MQGSSSEDGGTSSEDEGETSDNDYPENLTAGEIEDMSTTAAADFAVSDKAMGEQHQVPTSSCQSDINNTV